MGEIFDIPHQDAIVPGKQPHRVKARSVLIYWAVQELGMSAIAVGLKLGMSQSAASRAAQHRRNIVEELGLNPEKSRNAYFHGHSHGAPKIAQIPKPYDYTLIFGELGLSPLKSFSYGIIIFRLYKSG